MMIAVLLASLTVFGSIGLMRVGPRAKAYRLRASMWRSQETEQQKHLALCQTKVNGSIRAASQLQARLHEIDQAEELAKRNADEAIWWRANAAHTEETIRYCAMMRRKYEYAASYPWLAVENDPRPPYWSGATGPTPK